MSEGRQRIVGNIGGQKIKTRGLELSQGEVHVLIVSLDYQGTMNPLTCSADGDAMEQLCVASGVNAYRMKDQECTKDNVLNAIGQVCGTCQPNDTFVFFFAGHGVDIRDTGGDEPDMKDECYALYDNQGIAIPVNSDPVNGSLLRDDELSDILIQTCHPDVNIIVISDCCHSGTMCDFDKQTWWGRKAISISGCKDSQTSGDTGGGGICTHSMMMAIESFQKKGKTSYTLFELFSRTLVYDDEIFHSAQDITCKAAGGFRPHDMLWPLVPKQNYIAPYTSQRLGGRLPMFGQDGGPKPAGSIVNSNVAGGSFAFAPNQVSSSSGIVKVTPAQPMKLAQPLRPTQLAQPITPMNFSQPTQPGRTQFAKPLSVEKLKQEPIRYYHAGEQAPGYRPSGEGRYSQGGRIAQSSTPISGGAARIYRPGEGVNVLSASAATYTSTSPIIHNTVGGGYYSGFP